MDHGLVVLVARRHAVPDELFGVRPAAVAERVEAAVITVADATSSTKG